MDHLTQLGRYQVVRVLGRGAMGEVYEGLDPRLNRSVAIKVISTAVIADPELRASYSARFIREAQAVARQEGVDVEHVLLDQHKVKLPVLGRALAGHYVVPYLAFHQKRRVPAKLLGDLDRAAAGVHGWLPVERIDDALYVVCTDPARVKDSGSVGVRFPQPRPVLCVTTRRDCAAMLDQYFGAGRASRRDPLHGQRRAADIVMPPTHPYPSDEHPDAA